MAEGGYLLSSRSLEREAGKPVVSIITIAFNVKDDLEKTIKNVLSQDYKNVEYIIVDGGSKDGSADILRQYDQDISRWVSEPDKGIYDAMNKGIKLATGDFLWFMNAGDVVFYNYNHRIHNRNLFPDPVIISIYIYVEETCLSCETTFGKELVDVFFCNESGFCNKIKLPVNIIIFNGFDVFFRAIHNQAAPVVVDEEESGICFTIIFNSKFNECFMLNVDVFDEKLNNSIITKL